MAKIGHVRIVVGDNATDEAVRKFNTDADVHVFLLQAGPAAAGLTLTAAHRIILMEPFATTGEEAQALNRCHRIGQKKHVVAETFYIPDSIEERMLALRPLVAARGGKSRHASSAASASASAVADNDSQSGDESEGGDDLAVLGVREGGAPGSPRQNGAAAPLGLQRVRYLLGLPNTLEEAAAMAARAAATTHEEELGLERATAETAARAAAEVEAFSSSGSAGVKRKKKLATKKKPAAKRPKVMSKDGICRI